MEMRLRKVGLSMFFLAMFAMASLAQDTRFNQFYTAPQYLNPAMTGVFDGQLRLNVNYRDQWSSILGSNPFRSMHAGVDMRFASFGNDYFSVGLNTLVDQAGDAQFRNTQFALSGSYLKQVGGAAYTRGAQYLVAGGQVGMGQYALNWSKLWFSDQYVPAFGFPDIESPTIDPLINGDSFTTDFFLDYNAGLLWYGIFDDDLSVYFGGAINHLSQPNVSLAGANVNLNRRLIIHGGGEFPLGGNGLSILPAFNFMIQGSTSSTTLGFNFRYTNHDWREVAIRAGIWPHFSRRLEDKRHIDETAFTFILEMSQWNFGVSYGLNTSSLKQATNSRGALEISMIYVVPSKLRSKQQPCPKF